MSASAEVSSFQPGSPDAAGIVSWVHIGDLHMTAAGEQNYADLNSIVDEINQAFSGSIAFVFLPGDVADQGSLAQYALVRSAVDRLAVPWCSIIGDHDVHEKSFDNYLACMAREKNYSFEVGPVLFLALNAFDIPDPGSFALLSEQLDWLEGELAKAGHEDQPVVLLLHCYPTDLKQGGARLRKLIGPSRVRLIDMGHTHYNEVANDGRTLYTATRSTGQIEEGPVGFAVTNIDGQVISWKFSPLGELPAVMITSPADERFIAESGLAGYISDRRFIVRAKTWGRAPMRGVVAQFKGETIQLSQTPNSSVWQAEIDSADLPDGVYPLAVEARDINGHAAGDSVRMVRGPSAWHAPERAERDQDNAVAAWPERGLLGTQLGPNKNGRKW